jgi:DNA-binding response OmpR family regulator
MALPVQSAPNTILLGENEPLLLKFVRTILERAGFRVLSAGTPEDAIRIERDYTGTIDLLLTGASMPRMSGLELAKELKRRRPALRVMVMSSDPAASDIARNYRWYFTEKPFLPSVLLGRIRNALGLDSEGPAASAFRLPTAS